MDIGLEKLGWVKRAVDEAIIVAITDKKGDIIYANKKFCEISKYSEEELIGKNHRILKSGYHTPEFYRDLWSNITSGKTWQADIKNRAKDGSFYWVRTTIFPIVGNDSKPEYYVSVRADITDLKNQLQELYASQQL